MTHGRHLLLACALLALWPTPANAGHYDPRDVVPPTVRARYRNPDGSCVYCSIGIAGVHHGSDNAAQILWPSKYGPACRGGSWSDRVRRDFEQRGLEAWHIEGPASLTMAWIDWALSTGRYAAVTLTTAHMQTAVGISKDRQTIYVCDNNSPQQVDPWPRARFIREHTAHGGGWAVILRGPRPLPWVQPARPADAYRRPWSATHDGTAGLTLRGPQ